MNIEEIKDVIIKCWRKHSCGDDSIGWEELADILNDTVSNMLGQDEYLKLQDKYIIRWSDLESSTKLEQPGID